MDPAVTRATTLDGPGLQVRGIVGQAVVQPRIPVLRPRRPRAVAVRGSADPAGRTGALRLFGVTTDATERKCAEEEIVDAPAATAGPGGGSVEDGGRERRQIAAALHDQLGSLLAVAQMQLDSVRIADGDERLDAMPIARSWTTS